MSKIFEVESSSNNQTSLLLYGNNNPLIKTLISSFISNLVIYYDGNVEIQNTKDQSGNLHILDINNSKPFEKININFDYCILILNSTEDKKNISIFFEKLKKNKTKTLVLFPIRSFQIFYDLILEFKNNNNFYFILLGDVFTDENGASSFSMSKILQNVKANNKIILAGNELYSIFPISEDDAIKGIGQILFGNTTQDKIFYLFYKHPQSIISMVNILKKIIPNLKIEFSKIKTEDDSLSFQDFERFIKSKILINPVFIESNFQGFEESLKKLMSENPKDQSEVLQKKELKYIDIKKNNTLQHETSNSKNNDIQNKNYQINYIAHFKALLIILLFYVAFNFITFLCLIFFFDKSKLFFKNQDLVNTENYLYKSNAAISILDPQVNYINNLFQIKNMPFYYEYIKIKDLSSFLDNWQKALVEFKNSFSEDYDKEEFNKIISNMYSSHQAYQKIKSEINIDDNSLDEIIGKDSLKIINLSSTFSQIFGYEKEMKYLILFQNEENMRPTGGAIQNIAELTFQKGKIKSLKINDVSKIDESLKGRVEPHFIARRYLKDQNMYLKSINYYSDFEKTASYSAFIYNLGTNIKVDGVIALNYKALKEILNVLGPITLSKFNKTLSKDNVLEFINDTVESKTAPNVNQRKEILEEVLNEIFLKIGNETNSFYKVFSILSNIFENKQILFSFRDNSIQSVFSSQGYNGSLNDRKQKNSKTIYDFLAINEGNLSDYQISSKIKRSFDYSISVDENTSNSRLKIIYQNIDSSQESKMYIQVTTPPESVFKNIIIDGEEQKVVDFIKDPAIYENKKFKEPKEFELINEAEDDKHLFGFIINIPANSTKKIELEYNNPSLNLEEKTNYNLLVIKQPGIENYGFNFELNLPENNKAKVTEKNPIVISKDTEVKAEITK